MKTQTLKNKSTRNAIRICALPIAAFLAVTASAATGTWTGGGSGNWDTTDANWSVVTGTPWDITNGPSNTASFATAGDSANLTADVYPNAITFLDTATVTAGGGKIFYAADNTSKTITVDPTFTGTINAPINFGGTGNTGNILIVNGGGTLALAGDVKLAANDGGNKSSYFQVNAASTLNITGRLNTMIMNSSNRLSNVPAYMAGVSGGNTVNVTGSGKLVTGNFNIGVTGNASTDGNALNISSAGTLNSATDPATNTASFVVYGNGAQLNLNSSNNTVQFSGGAFVQQTNGGGAAAWTIGNGTAGNASSNNSITATGTGTIVSGRSNGSYNTVGNVAGSGNSLQILAGAIWNGGRVGVGMGNGTDAASNNFQLISGSGSFFIHNGGSNSFFNIGNANNASGNNFRVEAGGRADIFGTGTTREFAIGKVTGSDNNYVKVTGSGSNLNFISGLELAVGGSKASAVGGAGNHVDIFDGGTMTMWNTGGITAFPTTGGVSFSTITGSTAMRLLGATSALNLGDGNAIAELKIGAGNGFTGVDLVNATSSVNFNKGRLTPGQTGNLLTGSGSVSFNGAAYFNIGSGFNSTVNRPITGVGSLTKEGLGTLTIDGSNQGITSIYAGNTTILGGTLSLNTAFLNDSSSVSIDGSGFFNLTFGGTDTIGSLLLAGVSQAPGVYDSSNSGGLITGSGSLTVAAVPEPGAAVSLLGGLGMLLGLRRRRS